MVGVPGIDPEQSVDLRIRIGDAREARAPAIQAGLVGLRDQRPGSLDRGCEPHLPGPVAVIEAGDLERDAAGPLAEGRELDLERVVELGIDPEGEIAWLPAGQRCFGIRGGGTGSPWSQDQDGRQGEGAGRESSRKHRFLRGQQGKKGWRLSITSTRDPRRDDSWIASSTIVSVLPSSGSARS